MVSLVKGFLKKPSCNFLNYMIHCRAALAFNKNDRKDMNFSHLDWETRFLKTNQAVRNDSFGIPARVKKVHYPIRLIRYWFMYHFLREASARGPVSVCEIGVDTGQMKQFVDSNLSAPFYSRWQAVDCKVQKEALLSSGYTEFVEADIESPDFRLNDKFDAMILLHVLEHLHEPENVVRKLAPFLNKGGIMIGGFPVTPHWLSAAREKKIRKTARKYGHVSVFSPQRVKAMAEGAGLTVEYMSGAFFMRKQGFFLENYNWWLRFNLFFGAIFPGWPGEVYWVFRKA